MMINLDTGEASKATLRHQIKLKQQEVEAWQQAFKEAGNDVQRRSTASQNYLLAQQDLKTLKDLAKTLDVDTAPKKEVQRSVTQMVQDKEPSLLNEMEAFEPKVVSDHDHEKRLVADFEYFCRHLEITYRPGLNPDHPEGGFGPFVLAEGQRKLAALMIDKMLIRKESLRLVILKSRQLGCTTFLLAFWIWLGLVGWALHSTIEFSLYIPALAWTGFALMGLAIGRDWNRLDTQPGQT